MRVLYHDRVANEVADKELGAKRVDFDTLLVESDFVSVHVDLNDSTQGMFDAAAFRKMKSTAVFVNSARGPIHVQADLCQALQSGEIFAAGLDVTDPEPVSPDDPLLTLPNCVIAPHIASATVSQPKRHGRDRRRQPARRIARRAAALLCESRVEFASRTTGEQNHA